MSSDKVLHPTAKRNVETIAEVERQLLRKRSTVERIGETIAWYFGSLRFVIAHLLFIFCWVLWNTGTVPGLDPFDRYPFGLLSLLIGAEFIFLTTFVLMNQKHQLRRTEHWGHLDLQLTMLTEQEVTKNMQMLRMICKHLGLKAPSQDQEVAEMTQSTQVTALINAIGKVRETETLVEELAESRQDDEHLVAKVVQSNP
jgi:uncharacterized membrane protein